jgi:hypothetical protein
MKKRELTLSSKPLDARSPGHPERRKIVDALIGWDWGPKGAEVQVLCEKLSAPENPVQKHHGPAASSSCRVRDSERYKLHIPYWS